ncbi:MAG: translation initiation factor IF-3, partial [Chlorobi bacterium]|nr:translation initiation factor IF-3 [Chlorobiota bacterium]
MNEFIRSKECRLIANDNQMIGVKSIKDALAMAEDAGLDLVEIAPQAKPPVCKIIDYGKFLYEQQKREKQQKKLQHNTQLKEIRFKWRTDTHD